MSWSPDARHLAVMVFNRVDTTGAIAWLSTEDGSIRRLARLPRWHWGELAHSSDGAFIAVGQPVQADSGRRDIYLVATDGSGVAPLVSHPAADRLVGWVPNSEHFLFLSDRSGDWDLWQIQVVAGRASGEPRVVRRSVGEIVPLGFAGGDALFYALSSWHFTTSVAPFNPSTGEIDEAARTPLRDPSVGALWSPGGDRMALLVQTARGYAQFSLGVRNVATGEQRLLAPQLYPDQPSWFPDGRAILLPGFERDRPAAGQALYRVDVATGEATALLEFERDPTEYGLTPVG
ncbi:MAG: hypothetical protein GTO05_14880, partial [Gemmatimonadales bacterium]|nr:hypothetical protein [Gemmatimonadales bacterium]